MGAACIHPDPACEASGYLAYGEVSAHDDEIFWHYQKLTQRFYKNNRTGDLMNRISEDVGKVRMYVGPAFMYSINTISLFIIVISYMLSIAPGLTLYTLLPLPVLPDSPNALLFFDSLLFSCSNTAIRPFATSNRLYNSLLPVDGDDFGILDGDNALFELLSAAFFLAFRRSFFNFLISAFKSSISF